MSDITSNKADNTANNTTGKVTGSTADNKDNPSGNSKLRDSSAKIIFADPILCSQFLSGYLDIPLLKNVQPEDIEDVTNRYVHLFTEERNSDVVKKVHIAENAGSLPFYIISIIEHKSQIDYNVVMQVLRYIVFIWEDYEKEMSFQDKSRRGIWEDYLLMLKLLMCRRSGEKRGRKEYPRVNPLALLRVKLLVS